MSSGTLTDYGAVPDVSVRFPVPHDRSGKPTCPTCGGRALFGSGLTLVRVPIAKVIRYGRFADGRLDAFGPEISIATFHCEPCNVCVPPVRDEWTELSGRLSSVPIEITGQMRFVAAVLDLDQSLPSAGEQQ